MKVYVNDRPVVIFRGCRAKDALMRHFKRIGRCLSLEGISISDEWGNEIADDSPMTDDARIFYNEEAE